MHNCHDELTVTQSNCAEPGATRSLCHRSALIERSVGGPPNPRTRSIVPCAKLQPPGWCVDLLSLRSFLRRRHAKAVAAPALAFEWRPSGRVLRGSAQDRALSRIGSAPFPCWDARPRRRDGREPRRQTPTRLPGRDQWESHSSHRGYRRIQCPTPRPLHDAVLAGDHSLSKRTAALKQKPGFERRTLAGDRRDSAPGFRYRVQGQVRAGRVLARIQLIDVPSIPESSSQRPSRATAGLGYKQEPGASVLLHENAAARETVPSAAASERFGQSASRWSPGSAALLLAFQCGTDLRVAPDFRNRRFDS